MYFYRPALILNIILTTALVFFLSYALAVFYYSTNSFL